jgi:uncharacterized SAM-binding protein YcdF (DUF218 family)
MIREVPKAPYVPVHFSDLYADLTQACFGTGVIQPVGVVFAFGSWKRNNGIAEHLFKLYKAGVSRDFIITGGIPTADMGYVSPPVADTIYAALPNEMKEACTIHIQNKSVNSLEDVVFAKPYLDLYFGQTIGCVARNWAFLRQRLTLEKFISGEHIKAMPYAEHIEGDTYLTAENWFNYEEYRQKIWGELLRIKLYGERGDIHYPDHIRQKIETWRVHGE